MDIQAAPLRWLPMSPGQILTQSVTNLWSDLDTSLDRFGPALTYQYAVLLLLRVHLGWLLELQRHGGDVAEALFGRVDGERQLHLLPRSGHH